MAQINVSQEIEAPVERVFAFADDHDNLVRFIRGFSNLQWTTKTHEIGTRLKADARAAGITMNVEFLTEQVEPNHRVAGSYSSGLKGTWEWLFQPTDKGTRLTFSSDYELPMGILGQITDRAIVERENRANAEATLRSLKEMVEKK